MNAELNLRVSYAMELVSYLGVNKLDGYQSYKQFETFLLTSTESTSHLIARVRNIMR